MESAFPSFFSVLLLMRQMIFDLVSSSREVCSHRHVACLGVSSLCFWYSIRVTKGPDRGVTFFSNASKASINSVGR